MRVPKALWILLLLTAVLPAVSAVGINLAYFLPLPLNTGYLSVPVPPLALNGTVLQIVKNYLAVDLDLGLNYMPGYSLGGLDFDLTTPPMGPSTVFESGISLRASVPVGALSFSIIGGGFTFYFLDLKVNRGNFDRDLMAFKGWTALTSELSFANNWGFGYKVGGGVAYNINKKLKISVRGIYYNGSAPLELSGTITGGASSIGTEDLAYPDARVLYTGVKIIIGGDYAL